MKKIILGILLALFATNLTLYAKVETTTTTRKAQGQGYGATYEEALNKALADAISRMYGGTLQQNTAFLTNSVKSGKEQSLEKSYIDAIQKATKGSFSSYDVISSNKTSDGYEVKVVINKTTTTKKYKAPGLSADSRRSIIVFDATADSNVRKISPILQQSVIKDLLHSRKFNVLDRDTKGYYEAEKAIIQSGDVASDEVYKLKNVLATDYILLVSMRGIDADSKKSNLTGKETIKAEVVVDYRVMLFATRQIKFQNTLSMKVNFKDGGLSATNAGFEQISARISSDILNAIYPLKISDIQNDEVIFTQTIAQGDTFECFALGDVIRDPYTKEPTGRVETKSGSIEIVRSTPKLSYARITEGSVKKGDICRPLGGGSGNGYTIGKDANYQLEEGGGINLGW
ncbi:hypothetical protein [Helicobacter sp. MIT 05-5294]|uniref:hypothetical protein n=1 Tax=Helicobacter sp. MIT 05-5294 TaxID=1548150 RepID=UPI00051FD922|nr:hypothetical protein [Helicobacter sp. MIT 05-5294]TLD89162.1 hypothetical protein LS69_000560 [Helicobacter sp. MIT 05-5294]